VQAERRLARALELTQPDDPDRPRLLVRWADASMQAGRPREAAAALDAALDALRAGEAAEAAAQALQLRSRLALRLGEGTQVALAVEAVDLLEESEAGASLVAAHAQLAHAQMIAGAYAEGIAAADRACALAQELGLREPARAVGYRGYGRAYRGDESGLEEMEQALTALIDQGEGREAAILQNNLAIVRYPLEGPARSLAQVEEGIAFCEARGLAEPAAQLESNLPVLLTELGRPDEALERAGRLAVALEARGDTHSLLEVRAVVLATGLARGEQPARAAVDWLVETARRIAAADIAGIGLAAAAAALSTEAPERACSLLAEVEQRPGVRETPYYARQLPGMVRIALAAGEHELAGRLVRGLEPLNPLDEHALCAGRAQLTENEGRLDEAAELFAEAATRWWEFGHVPERAHAMLGEGRCLVGLGRPGAEEALREARDLFAQMGYRPALGTTEALLEAMTAVSEA
jgi:tetratricopeptide (TPR) repeat protein